MVTSVQPAAYEAIYDCYKRWPGAHDPLLPCPLCGSPAQLWQYAEKPTDELQKVVMCSSTDDDWADFPELGMFTQCVLAMPPNSFYMATAKAAVRLWNNYTRHCVAMRARNALPSGDPS